VPADLRNLVVAWLCRVMNAMIDKAQRSQDKASAVRKGNSHDREGPHAVNVSKRCAE